MPDGIRATVVFASEDVCPVARLSASAEATVDAMSSSVAVPGSRGSATDFYAATDRPPEGVEFDRIFTTGSTDLYRTTHDGEASCPCECLGRFGCPAARYVARDGVLTIVFHAADFEQLQAVIGDLRDRFPGVDIRRLVRSPTAGDPSDAVFVDRGKLTDRQRQVLRAAFDAGYFERPRRANATELAADLGIDPSTFAEHLSAAQSKLLADLFEESG